MCYERLRADPRSPSIRRTPRARQGPKHGHRCRGNSVIIGHEGFTGRETQEGSCGGCVGAGGRGGAGGWGGVAVGEGEGLPSNLL
jgi:hypothetical protein